jgi:hypothetical protein
MRVVPSMLRFPGFFGPLASFEARRWRHGATNVHHPSSTNDGSITYCDDFQLCACVAVAPFTLLRCSESRIEDRGCLRTEKLLKTTFKALKLIASIAAVIVLRGLIPTFAALQEPHLMGCDPLQTLRSS